MQEYENRHRSRQQAVSDNYAKIQISNVVDKESETSAIGPTYVRLCAALFVVSTRIARELINKI